MTVIERERADVLNKFAAVETIEEVAKPSTEEDATKLDSAIGTILGGIGPVRASIAADLLKLSPHTVRTWTKEGVLLEAESERSKVLHVDPLRLHAVLHLARKLRDLGTKPNELMDQIWYRLADRALMEREDLQESIAQWKRGEVVPL
ncbi:hypothetical protein ACVDFE_00400 [Lentzea chajnantorensis]